MRNRTPLLAVGVVVAVVAVLSGAVAVVLIKDDGLDAATLLARAGEYVEKQGGVHFEGEVTIESLDPQTDESLSVRTRVEGDTDFADSRVIARQGGLHTEVLEIGRVIFERSADSESGLRQEKFGRFDLDEENRRAGIIAPGDPAADPSRAGEPATLPDLLKGARAVRISRQANGVVVLRADVSGPVFAEAEVDGDARLELTMKPSGVVDAAKVTADAEDVHVVADYAFTQWGKAVDVVAPPAAQIDPTPLIDEEALAEWNASPLLSPRALPGEWVLDGAYVVPEEETAEDCDQVALDYIDPEDEEAGYLTLFQIPASCEGVDLDPPRGAQPFTVGGSAGWVEESGDGIYAQVLIGETVVQADTDLALDVLTAVLISLGPLDLNVEHTPLGSGRGNSSA